MKIETTDEYEEMAAAFQCFQIQCLYRSLKENGIEETKIRKVCEDFTHSFGVALDQQWIESEEGKVFPVVGFTRKHLEHQPDELHIKNGIFSFAEYAFGDIAWFFEENDPSENPQKYGSVKSDENTA